MLVVIRGTVVNQTPATTIKHWLRRTSFLILIAYHHFRRSLLLSTIPFMHRFNMPLLPGAFLKFTHFTQQFSSQI
jgi:hypothetical protein